MEAEAATLRPLALCVRPDAPTGRVDDRGDYRHDEVMVRTVWLTHFRTSELCDRARSRRWIAAALAVLGGFAVALTSESGLQRESMLLLMTCLLAMPFAWAFFTGFSHVRVGVDRIEVDNALGRLTLRQDEILSFRYVGPLSSPREWYVESERGFHLLGAGPAATRLVLQMLEQWPWIQKPSDAELSALGAPDYRHESKDPDELATLLRVPSLAGESRVRVATLLVQQGEAYRQQVEEIAGATLDPSVRSRLRSL